MLPLILSGFAFAADPAVPPPPAAPTAGGGIGVTVGPGAAPLPIALPKPLADSSDLNDESDEIWKVVRRDLEMSGYFDVKDPASYIEQGKGVEPGSFSFGDWTIIKASALAKVKVTTNAKGPMAAVYVYDVTGQSLIDKRGWNFANNRAAGHQIADEIIWSLTGQHSVFGARLAVVGTRNGHKEIYLMDMDGQGVTAVTANGTINLSPAWSPNRGTIAFTSYKRDNADLYLKDLASGAVRAISAKAGVDSGAAYSPDGTKIALARSDGNGDSDIYIIDASTGADVLRLTNGGGIDVAPDWSADGKWIAFQSERAGGSQIYVVSASGGEPKRVTREGGFNSDPVFAPDGSRIAFVGRDQHFDVFTCDLDGKNVVRITQDMGDNEDPDWSPDGNYLVFSSTRDGASRIWLSTMDGVHQAVITDASSGWTQPTFAP